jgi:hypothetical protein
MGATDAVFAYVGACLSVKQVTFAWLLNLTVPVAVLLLERAWNRMHPTTDRRHSVATAVPERISSATASERD